MWNSNHIKVPCRGCADRTPGCHGGCERYGEFRRQVEHVNHEIVMLKRGDPGLSEARLKASRERAMSKKRGRF